MVGYEAVRRVGVLRCVSERGKGDDEAREV